MISRRVRLISVFVSNIIHRQNYDMITVCCYLSPSTIISSTLFTGAKCRYHYPTVRTGDIPRFPRSFLSLILSIVHHRAVHRRAVKCVPVVARVSGQNLSTSTSPSTRHDCSNQVLNSPPPSPNAIMKLLQKRFYRKHQFIE